MALTLGGKSVFDRFKRQSVGIENHWCAEPSKCIAFLHLLKGGVTGRGESIRVIRFLLFCRIAGVLGDNHLNFWGLRDGRKNIH